MVKISLASSIILGVATILAAGCGREEAVSFSAQVKPILDASCMDCHREGGEGHVASGFSVETYEDVMAGTRYGPMVVAGDPLGSNLLVLIEGRADPSISMPHGSGTRLAQAEIETIRTWIEQGAPNN